MRKSVTSTAASRSGCSGLRRVLMGSVGPVLGVAVGLGVSQAAFAQTQLEEMVVTATKRSLDLQAVPASVSAFSGETMSNRGIKTIEDLSHSTPNLTIAMTGGTTPQLSIRGVSADGVSPVLEGTVALHVDGIYQPRSFGLQLTMMDLDSVEVLRGPQGTVYGRNANAGVINLNTAKPTDVFEGKATILGSNQGGWRYGAKGYVSGPVAENISMRLSGMIDRNQGYVEDLTNGGWLNGSNQYGGRLSVRMTPADDLTIDLSGSFFKDHNSSSFALSTDPLRGSIIADASTGPTVNAAGVSVPGGTILGTHNYTLLQQRYGDNATHYQLTPWKTYQTFRPDNTTKLVTGSAVVAWDITPDVSLRSITGWQWATSHSLLDQDGMNVDYLPARPYADSHTWSQEFNLNAKLFEDRVDLVAGLYYMYDMVKGGNINPIPTGNPVGSAATPGLFLNNLIDQETKSKAAFLDLTLNVTDELRLLGGVRRTIDTRNTVQQIRTVINASPYLGPLDLPGSSMLGGCADTARPEQVFNSTTFKAGAQYDFTPDVMGYVQWQNGFKDGGYNVSSCNNTYEPEKIYSWEFGLKTTLFNGTTTLNVTYFDYRYINMQLSRTINTGPTTITSLIDNAAQASLKGAEIELNSNLTDDLSTDLSVGILDGKYGSLSSRNGGVPGNPLVDLTGKTLPRAPKLTINAGLNYNFSLGDLGEAMVRGEYNYTGKTYYTPFNEPIATQGGYSLFNLFLTVTPVDCENLEIQLFAKNLTDKYYRNSMYSSGIMFMSRANMAPPREIGAQLTAKF